MIYDECTNDEFRRNAIIYMARLSDGEEEEKWLSKISDNLNHYAGITREWNHLSKGRKEEAFLSYQKNVIEYFQHFMWMIDCYHQNYSDLVSSDDRLAVFKINLDLQNIMYDGDVDNSLIYEDMARLYFSLIDKKNGYLYLEKTLDTWINSLETSESEDIPYYKSPLFNQLKRNKPQRKAGTNIYLNKLKTEKEYDCVRHEERFIKCVSRFEELLSPKS